MLKRFNIYIHKDKKTIFDMQKWWNHDFKKSNTECTVKAFPLNTPDEEIENYINEKLGGNPDLNY